MGIGLRTFNWTMNDSISVIIPVYNGERYLAEAIESVLKQTLPPAEVIVVDDGSTDYSAAIAQSFATVRYLHQPNAGSNAARNRGILHSTGNFLAFLDADDLWMPDKLAVQLAAFSQEPSLDFVYGYVEQFYSSDLPAGERAGWVDTSQPRPGIHQGTLLARRSSFLKIGIFREDRIFNQFVDWYALAQENGMCERILPDVVMRRRVHDSNMSLRGGEQAKRSFAHALKATLDRRRAENKSKKIPDRLETPNRL